MDENIFVNTDAQPFDMYSFGVFTTVVVAIAHHVQAYLNTRNWSLYVAWWFFFGVLMLILTLVVTNSAPDSFYYKLLFDQLLSSIDFNGLIFFAVITLSIPIIANRKYKTSLAHTHLFDN